MYKLVCPGELLKPENPICSQVIDLLAKVGSRKVVKLFIELLDSDNREIRTHAIEGLGRMSAFRAVPKLLELFRLQNVDDLEALIIALTHFKEKSIVPSLVTLFDSQPQMGIVILEALNRFEAETELASTLLMFERNKLRYDGEVNRFFAVFFAEKDHFEEVIELLYDHDHPILKFPDRPKPSDVWHLMKVKLFGQAEFDEGGLKIQSDTKAEKYAITEQRRRNIYQGMQCQDVEIVILETIYCFDHELARIFARKVFETRDRDIGRVLLDMLDSSSLESERRRLLIGLCWRCRIKMTIPYLRGCLDSADEVILCLAIESLGRFKDHESVPKIMAFLRAAGEMTLETALNALAHFGEKGDTVIKDLPELVRGRPVFRSVVAGGDHSIVMRQLKQQDYQVMGRDMNPQVRYLAAIYCGLIGHGSAVEWIGDLLNDGTPIGLANRFDHRTVDQGARFALERIGTPSATALLNR